MKILVTGLCLSRNLGGPAMGLTLVDELQRRAANKYEFVFAVDPLAIEQEQRWSKHYGLPIVRRDHIVKWGFGAIRVLFYLKQCLWWLKKRPRQLYSEQAADVHREYMAAISDADAIVDLSGIAYVGDGFRGPSEGLVCISNYLYARHSSIPYMRFVQSLGPFQDWRVRLFARYELNRLPTIFARGPTSANNCRELLKRPEAVFECPDIAILLGRDDAWAEHFLREHDLQRHNYTVISPSAVIAGAADGAGSTGDLHVDALARIAQRLVDRGEKLLFLSHMYSDNPAECDREVARRVADRLTVDSVLVEQDIDPMMAKALIAGSRMAIVSRYHALVAALSTGVDVVALGWNVKYHDLMSYYGKTENAIDVRSHTPAELATRVAALIDSLTAAADAEKKQLFEESQARAEERVYEAFDQLEQWLSNAD